MPIWLTLYWYFSDTFTTTQQRKNGTNRTNTICKIKKKSYYFLNTPRIYFKMPGPWQIILIFSLNLKNLFLQGYSQVLALELLFSQGTVKPLNAPMWMLCGYKNLHFTKTDIVKRSKTQTGWISLFNYFLYSQQVCGCGEGESPYFCKLLPQCNAQWTLASSNFTAITLCARASSPRWNFAYRTIPSWLEVSPQSRDWQRRWALLNLFLRELKRTGCSRNLS